MPEKGSSLPLTHERQYDTKTLITEEFRSLKNTTEKLKSRYEKFPTELIRVKGRLDPFSYDPFSYGKGKESSKRT